MFHHTIKVEDSKGFEIRTVIASNSNEHKTLTVIVVPFDNSMRYEVSHYKSVIHEGTDLAKAVVEYNEIYESTTAMSSRSRIAKKLAPVNV